jgi:hypothetical protein
VPSPVRVKKPGRDHSRSWVARGRGAGVEHGREFAGCPVAWGPAGDDRGDLLAAGGRLRRPGPGGGVAAGLPRLSGGVGTVMSMAVMAVVVSGRASSRLR